MSKFVGRSILEKEKISRAQEVNSMSKESLVEELNKTYGALESVMRESFMGDFTGQFIDPWDRFFADGEFWLPLNDTRRDQPGVLGTGDISLETWNDLQRMWHKSRRMATRNEYAINILENAVNFVVGKGLTYLVVKKPGMNPPDSTINAVQEVVDEFLEENEWNELEQELIIRGDRDGEWFLRKFPQADGSLLVRTIEPEEVFTPEGFENREDIRFGILNNGVDKQTAIGYYVNRNLVDATEIVHQKFNVDRSVARGVSTLWPIWPNLDRAEKLLRNMSRVATIQSALVGARKFSNASERQVNDFVEKSIRLKVVDRSSTSFSGGGFSRAKDFRAQEYRGGTILNMGKNQDFDFYTKGVASDRFIPVLQTELRGIASRVMYPEFVLTSNASDTNFASAMIAESPFVRMIERRQGKQIRVGRRCVWNSVKVATVMRRLPPRVLKQVMLQVVAPNPVVRDARKQAQANQIKTNHGVISPQEWVQEDGRSYRQTMENIEVHTKEFGEPLKTGGMPPQDTDDTGDPEDKMNDEKRDRETTGERRGDSE